MLAVVIVTENWSCFRVSVQGYSPLRTSNVVDQPIEGERMVGGTKSGVKNAGWPVGRLIAAMGTVATLVAIGAVGCGGGNNTSIFPFAGLWVANSGGANVTHFTGS